MNNIVLLLSEEHFLHYKDLCQEATALANTKKKDFVEAVIKKSENKTRTLYQVVNKVLDRKQSRFLPDYTEDIEVLASDFNKFFSEKVEKIRESIPASSIPECSDTNVTPLLEFEPTCISELEDIIKESGINCSPNDVLPQDLVKDNRRFFKMGCAEIKISKQCLAIYYGLSLYTFDSGDRINKSLVKISNRKFFIDCQSPENDFFPRKFKIF